MTLRIPAFTGTETKVEAALAYAEAGMFVLPVAPGMKHPGSVVGDDWTSKSSRDPAQIKAWFDSANGSKRGIAIDCGKSGLVVLDVDNPQHYSGPVSPIQQQTRADQPDRRHMVFAQPEGRRIGCAGGAMGKEWGEVRGHGGVVMAYPSTHPETGGLYTWAAGAGQEIPTLPAETARKIPDKSDRPSTPVDADEALDYLEQQLSKGPGSDVKGIDQLLKWYHDDVSSGSGRHEAIRAQLLKAMRWASLGKVHGENAAEALMNAFVADVTSPAPGKRTVSEEFATAESLRILLWAIAEVQAEVAGKLTTEILDSAADSSDDWDEDDHRPQTTAELIAAARRELAANPMFFRGNDIIDAVEYRDPMIRDTLVRAGVGQIYGDSGAGKSQIALTLACAIADPEIAEWFGRRIYHHGHVIYVCWEGAEVMKQYAHAWRNGNQRDLPEMLHFAPHGQRWDLSTDDGMKRFIESLEMEVYGDPIALIILDTQILAFAGANFNDNAEMAKIWARMKRVAKELDTLILTVAHTAKAARGTGTAATASGAGTQYDSSDQSILVSHDADSGTYAVHCNKIKGFPAWEHPVAFERVRETLGENQYGDPIISVWARPLGDVKYDSTPDEPKHRSFDDLVLEIFRGHTSLKLRQVADLVMLDPTQRDFSAPQIMNAVKNSVHQRLAPRGLVESLGGGLWQHSGEQS